MKSLFNWLVMSIFTIGVVAFGADATMNINANVMDKLTIRVDEHAEFGNVTRGERYTTVGKYSLQGEAGQKVLVKFGTDGVVQLKHESGASIPVTLSHTTDVVTMVPYEFVSAEPIKFTMDVVEYAVKGVYSGDILLSARYE